MAYDLKNNSGRIYVKFDGDLRADELIEASIEANLPANIQYQIMDFTGCTMVLLHSELEDIAYRDELASTRNPNIRVAIVATMK